MDDKENNVISIETGLPIEEDIATRTWTIGSNDGWSQLSSRELMVLVRRAYIQIINRGDILGREK